MTLIKYNPEFANVENRSFSKFLDRFFNESVVSANKSIESFSPQVDVAEDKKEYELSFAVPGMKKSDFNIDLSEGKITISGERKFESKKEDKNYHAVETKYGAFSRSFYLPDNIVEDKVEATYQDGILKVTIPKDEKKELRKTIQIK